MLLELRFHTIKKMATATIKHPELNTITLHSPPSRKESPQKTAIVNNRITTKEYSFSSDLIPDNS